MKKGVIYGVLGTIAMLLLIAAAPPKYVTPATLTASNQLAFTVTTNELVLNGYRTNGATRAIVSVSVQLSAAVAGTAKASLVVESATITNRATASAGPLASLVEVAQLTLPVSPNLRYYVTNETSGSGATVAIVSGTSSVTGL